MDLAGYKFSYEGVLRMDLGKEKKGETVLLATNYANQHELYSSIGEHY